MSGFKLGKWVVPEVWRGGIGLLLFELSAHK